jgi:transposase
MTSIIDASALVEHDVIGGVDSHADTHTAAVLDSVGRRLGSAQFPATATGYRDLERWLAGHGRVAAVGVESTGSYAAALTRHLRSAGLRVVEVNQPHAHARARRGKSDAIDAEMAARKVLSNEVTVVPKDTTGVVESIRQLKVARTGAVKSRSAALVTLGALIVTAPTQLREQLDAASLTGRAQQAARLRPDPADLADPLQAAKFALRSLARQIADLDAQITALDHALTPLVTVTAPRTLALLGIGVQHGAQLLLSIGQNGDRVNSEAAFAHLCGVSPLLASSGKTDRHRLNHGGDRQANSALHMITVVRLRHCERTRVYMSRRLAEGKTKREAMRCLKRYIARQVYGTLTADLKDLDKKP